MVALAIDAITGLLDTFATHFDDAAMEVAGWPSTSDPSLIPRTRDRLERTLERVTHVAT